MPVLTRTKPAVRTHDSFFDSQREALREAHERMNDAACEGFLTRVQRSPFGGFVVRSIPADFLVDLASEGSFPLINSVLGGSRNVFVDE